MGVFEERVVRFFRKSRPPVGSRPGTLAPPEGSPPPVVYVWEYGPQGANRRQVEDLAELERLAREPVRSWIDVQGLGDIDTLEKIGAIFGIKPLALEDAVNVPQRAKSEIHPDHHLVIARAPVPAGGRIDFPQVALFIGAHYLLTFQERHFGFFQPIRARLEEGRGPIWQQGPDYLAYALIDALVDAYYPVVEDLTQELEDLEEQVLDERGSEILTEIHAARRKLLVVRRVGRPQRLATRELADEDSPFIGEFARGCLRDSRDHIAQVVELAESSHEFAVGLTETYLSLLSHQTNEIMKLLTLMASIFIPLTFIAGLYGMNFEFMPELQQRWAYPTVLLLMGCAAVGMLFYFRRRGWIRRRRAERDP